MQPFKKYCFFANRNMMMKLNYILLGCIIVSSFACTPTAMQQSWSNPDIRDSTKLFQKILFVALVKDAYTRKVAEDKLVEEVRPRGVASYNYLPDYYTSSSDTGMISNRLKEDGFDGIVIMRLVTVDKNAVNNPGNFPSYYNSWYGYYSSTFPLYNTRSNNAVNEVYSVETNVYSLLENKLVWNGVTTAVNISDKKKLVDGVIATVKEKMKSQGLIK
jgi:hypothetical protein